MLDNPTAVEYEPCNISIDNPTLGDYDNIEQAQYFDSNPSRAGLKKTPCQEDGISSLRNMNMCQLDGNESVEDSDDDSISNYSTDNEVDCGGVGVLGEAEVRPDQAAGLPQLQGHILLPGQGAPGHPVSRQKRQQTLPIQDGGRGLHSLQQAQIRADRLRVRGAPGRRGRVGSVCSPETGYIFQCWVSPLGRNP